MSTALKTIPFANWDEWIAIRNDLYSTSIFARLAAIERVSAWRRRGSVPHSMDMTAQFVDIMLKDPHFGYHELTLQHYDTENIQLLYSIIVVRAVNGLVDPNQQGYYAQSVLSLAEKLKLPGWIVELRHDATHNRLPSLSVLRAACSFMLQWFQTNYWEPQLTFLQQLTQLSVPPATLIPTPRNVKQLMHGWKQEFVKASQQSITFILDFFIPMFLTAITTITPYDEHRPIQEVVEVQKEKWFLCFEMLGYNMEKWIHGLFSKLVFHFLHILQSPASSVAIQAIQLQVLIVWMKFMILFYEKQSESRTSSKKELAQEKKRLRKLAKQLQNLREPVLVNKSDKELADGQMDEEEDEEEECEGEESVDRNESSPVFDQENIPKQKTNSNGEEGNVGILSNREGNKLLWKRQFMRCFEGPLQEKYVQSSEIPQGSIHEMLQIVRQYYQPFDDNSDKSNTQCYIQDSRENLTKNCTTAEGVISGDAVEEKCVDDTAKVSTSSQAKGGVEGWLQKFQQSGKRPLSATTATVASSSSSSSARSNKNLIELHANQSSKLTAKAFSNKDVDSKKRKSIENDMTGEAKHSMDYSEYLARSEKLKSMQLCNDFPPWVIGLLPGQYENIELQHVVVLGVEDM